MRFFISDSCWLSTLIMVIVIGIYLNGLIISWFNGWSISWSLLLFKPWLFSFRLNNRLGSVIKLINLCFVDLLWTASCQDTLGYIPCALFIDNYASDSIISLGIVPHSLSMLFNQYVLFSFFQLAFHPLMLSQFQFVSQINLFSWFVC